MMWYIPEDWSENDLFIWYLIWHSIFFTVITVRIQIIFELTLINSNTYYKTGIT
jgi:hypothetical protein